MITIFRLIGTEQNSYKIFPRGLARNKNYKVTFDNEGIFIKKTGEELIEQGIAVNIFNALSSEMLLFEEENQKEFRVWLKKQIKK